MITKPCARPRPNGASAPNRDDLDDARRDPTQREKARAYAILAVAMAALCVVE